VEGSIGVFLTSLSFTLWLLKWLYLFLFPQICCCLNVVKCIYIDNHTSSNIYWVTYDMPATVLKAFHALSFFNLLNTRGFHCSHSKVRTMRHKVINCFAQGHAASMWQLDSWTQMVWKTLTLI
jgi:hypothetical protein